MPIAAVRGAAMRLGARAYNHFKEQITTVFFVSLWCLVWGGLLGLIYLFYDTIANWLVRIVFSLFD